mgnify:CR=1 FL=1
MSGVSKLGANLPILTRSVNALDEQQESKPIPINLMPAKERTNYLQMKRQQEIKSIQPATRSEIVDVLAMVQAMCGTVELNEFVINGYIKYLEKFPRDLLQMAADNIIQNNTTYYNKFPAVSEFTSYMQSMLDGRKESIGITERMLAVKGINKRG